MFNVSRAASAPALSPEEWRPFKLVHKEPLTHTENPVWLFRFGLEDPNATIGLHVASCLLTRAPATKADGTSTWAIRPYTPITSVNQKGYFELAIKVYKVPSVGKVSNYIYNLNVGDSMDFKGPLPKMPIEDIAKRKEVGLVAGGSGLTPMLQVAEEVLRRKLPVKLKMIFGNVSEDDIIIKDHLDSLAATNDNFEIFHLVDKAKSPNWTGGVGYITAEIVEKHLPANRPDNLILVCGPPAMMNALSGDKLPDKSQGPLTGLFKSLGYTSENVYKF